MAIQFQCPHCSAQIRVPDQAAGKAGSCPQCKKKLLVPQIELPTVQPAAEEIAPPADLPVDEAPLEAPPPKDVEVIEERGKPSVAYQARHKQRKARAKRKGGLLMPLACLGVLAAIVVWFNWKNAPKLEGTLSAAVLSDVELPPRTVPKSLASLKAKDLQAVLLDLKENPVRMLSDLMQITVRGTAGGLEVEVHEAEKTHFVRISPKEDAMLRKFLEEHRQELETAHQAALAKGVQQFLSAWHGHINGDPVLDVGTYRDSLGLTALEGPFGYQVEAVTKKSRYRCVYEAAEGELYFLLPTGVKDFTLEGRKVDGRTLFTGRYTAQAGQAPPPRANPRQKLKLKSSSKKPAMESPDGEMERKMDEGAE